MTGTFTKILIAIGSVASIGFGVWHFTVPTAWNWYSYIDARASELHIAIRAVNIFFSLSLVLFGLINLLLAFGNRPDGYSIAVVLAATSMLWLARVLLQILIPQGTINPLLQYSMLLSFLVVFLCYAVPLFSMISRGAFR